MPVEAAPQARLQSSRCRIEINPRFRSRLATLGLLNAAAIMDLPGEIVSGHPSRHVVRIELDGGVFYLKRQHRIGWRERFRQWRAGFGWTSRSDREMHMLRELERAGFVAPNWVAYGETAGGAFLLLEELFGSIELRRFLRDNGMSQTDRRELAERLGHDIAELHAAGFATPDLTAKHLFVDRDTFGCTLIDWQNAIRRESLDSIHALAALHASLSEQLAAPRERLRFLRSYLCTLRKSRKLGRFAVLARSIDHAGARLRGRRSIRDQREPPIAFVDQRLVWLAGEAVCAVPQVAATWPRPAISPPFYDLPPGKVSYRLPDGRDAILIRGRSINPLRRLGSFLRGRPWRSPAARMSRLLFHLERYGIPAPRLFAFGQRITGRFSADWFILNESLTDKRLGTKTVSDRVKQDTAKLLAKLHNAGCRLDLRNGLPFRHDGSRAVVADPFAIRLVRSVTPRQRRLDLAFVLQLLESPG